MTLYSFASFASLSFGALSTTVMLTGMRGKCMMLTDELAWLVALPINLARVNF